MDYVKNEHQMNSQFSAKSQRRRRKLTVGEKRTSVNSVVSTYKGRKPSAERQFSHYFRKKIVSSGNCFIVKEV